MNEIRDLVLVYILIYKHSMNNMNALQFSPVSTAAPGALYAQLIANIKREIRAGRLLPDEALPSTRVLAADLRVSVITIGRAYTELEREGIVYGRQGQGTFVASNALDRLKDEVSAPLNHFLAGVNAMDPITTSNDELIRLFHIALNQRRKT